MREDRDEDGPAPRRGGGEGKARRVSADAQKMEEVNVRKEHWAVPQ